MSGLADVDVLVSGNTTRSSARFLNPGCSDGFWSDDLPRVQHVFKTEINLVVLQKNVILPRRVITMKIRLPGET